MIIDLEKTEPRNIQADICIIGAGAAGITLALDLADSGRRVVMLESGDFDFERETQNLYKGQNRGVPYFPLDACRLRQFGGSTNHWGGACWPLEAVDIEQKDWVPHSGWPITLDDLKPYYIRAHETLKLRDFQYSLAGQDNKASPIDLDTSLIEPRFYKTVVGKVIRLGKYYKDNLRKQSNLTVYLHANVTGIELADGNGAVRSVSVRSLEGKAMKVSVKTLVLATGGIENARILLYSTNGQARGIGNQHDLVGRYFMDHPFLPTTSSILFVPAQSYAFYLQHEISDGSVITGGFGLTAETVRKHQMLNAWFGMEVFSKPTFIADVKRMSRRKGVDQNNVVATSRELILYLASLHTVAKDINGKAIGYNAVNLTCIAEQVPNPASRVTLSHEKDALGLPRAVLDWRLTQKDYDSLYSWTPPE